jgi:metal-responsive CopG/Arc/MetJ family transcriptional regulator
MGLLKVSTKEARMATMNFSIPDEIKEEFQRAFAHENRSAVVAQLLKQAVEERKRQQVRSAAIDALLELRRGKAPVSDQEIAQARKADRP